MYYRHLWHQDFKEASDTNKENDTSLANQQGEQMSVFHGPKYIFVKIIHDSAAKMIIMLGYTSF